MKTFDLWKYTWLKTSYVVDTPATRSYAASFRVGQVVFFHGGLYVNAAGETVVNDTTAYLSTCKLTCKQMFLSIVSVTIRK